MERLLTFLFILIMINACKGPQADAQVHKDTKMNSKDLLFVGTYTDKEGHVDGKADGLYALNFDASNGTLEKTNLSAKITNPSYLFVDEQNSRLYSVTEKVDQGEVISSFVYTKDSITLVNQVDALGGAPCYLIRVGNSMLSANYMGGNLAVYSLGKDGSLEENTDLVQHSGNGPTSRQTSPHAHIIIENPHTGQIWTADLGTDEVIFYDFDTETGKLTKANAIKLEAGSGPRHIDFHPRMDFVYVINELNGSISFIKKVEGAYDIVQNIESTKMGEPSQAACADIHVHPNGKFLYASNRGPYHSIAIYNIAEDGTLTFKNETSSKGEVPRSFTIDPSGKYLLVANQNTDNIAVYSINQADGSLTDTGHGLSVPTPVCLKFE